ncbi:hypothetical protein K439DRAFT_1617626 [Ramaria rubella]|nr:hypothetical protein K439DRAFT_1617626 [Ramaria rubella]
MGAYGRCALKLQTPVVDDPGFFHVLAITQEGQDLEDVRPLITQVQIDGRTNRLDLQVVNLVVPGGTPQASVKCNHGNSTTMQEDKKGSKQDVEGCQDSSEKLELLPRHRKTQKDKDVEGYLHAKLEEWEGWQEFCEAKGRMLMNPEVVKYYHFAYKFYQEFDTRRTDKFNRIFKNHIWAALGYGKSWGTEMVGFIEQVNTYGPGGPKERTGVCERLAEIPNDGHKPEGTQSLLLFMKEEASLK